MAKRRKNKKPLKQRNAIALSALLRSGGPMGDKRLRREGTKKQRRQAAIAEWD